MNILERDWNGKTAQYETHPDSPYEMVTAYEWREESYEFDMTAIVRKKATGELFYATDQGCSCPSPFEDTTEADLKPIRRMQDWYDHVEERKARAAEDDAVWHGHEKGFTDLVARIAGQSAEQVSALLQEWKKGNA